MEQNYEIDYKKCWWGREKLTLDYSQKALMECSRDNARNCMRAAEQVGKLDDFESKFEYKRFGSANWPYFKWNMWADKAYDAVERKYKTRYYSRYKVD